MKQVTLAGILGVTKQHINGLKSGRTHFSVSLAEKAQLVTGIRWEKWVRPGKGVHPLIGLEKLREPTLSEIADFIEKLKKISQK